MLVKGFTKCLKLIMKDIKEIQEFNRRKIICAVHNTEDYREATLLDLGCSPKVAKEEALTQGDKWKISSPILSRVLLALENKDNGKKWWADSIGYIEGSLSYITWSDGCCSGCDIKDICKWDLTKETLEEQSEGCQRAVYKLLGGF